MEFYRYPADSTLMKYTTYRSIPVGTPRKPLSLHFINLEYAILPDLLTKTTDASPVYFTHNVFEPDTIRETSEVRETGASISIPNYYPKSCQANYKDFSIYLN